FAERARRVAGAGRWAHLDPVREQAPDPPRRGWGRDAHPVPRRHRRWRGRVQRARELRRRGRDHRVRARGRSGAARDRRGGGARSPRLVRASLLASHPVHRRGPGEAHARGADRGGGRFVGGAHLGQVSGHRHHEGRGPRPVRWLAAWSWLGIVLCVAPVAAATEGRSVAAPSSGAEPPAGAEPSAGSEAQAAERGDSAPHLGLRAYEEALAARKLAPTQPLSAERLRAELAQAEASLLAGRVAEAIAAAAALVESKRFEPFREGPEGRGLRFVLGDALGRAGADELAIAYLGPLTQGGDASARRAVRALVA